MLAFDCDLPDSPFPSTVTAHLCYRIQLLPGFIYLTKQHHFINVGITFIFSLRMSYTAQDIFRSLEWDCRTKVIFVCSKAEGGKCSLHWHSERRERLKVDCLMIVTLSLGVFLTSVSLPGTVSPRDGELASPRTMCFRSWLLPWVSDSQLLLSFWRNGKKPQTNKQTSK